MHLRLILLGVLFLFSITSFSQSWLDSLVEKGKQISGMDSCREYSDYTCQQLESSSYNVEVWYSPSNWGDSSTYLGRSNSLSGCSRMAYASANEKNRKVDDYICCLITDTSSCAEKHR